MRVAFVTARARSAVSVAAPYLASEFGARNVLVVRLPGIGASTPPLRRFLGRRIDRWSETGTGFTVAQAAQRSGARLVHARDGGSARASVNAFQPNLVVGVGLGDYGHEFGEGLRAPTLELVYGTGWEQTPEAAILWSVHAGSPTTTITYARLERDRRKDVVHTEPVDIPFESTLQRTVGAGVALLEKRAASALAGFAAWVDELLEGAVPLDPSGPKGIPSFGELRLIRDRHGGLRRQQLVTGPAALDQPNA